MDGLITYNERRALQKECRLLCENDGIENQIIHLESPDDNEVFQYVFDYLEAEMDKVMLKWYKLKEDIMRFKQRMI